MTDARFTNSQSPRASRDSTDDPEKHAKGEVKLGMNDPEESSEINGHAEKLADEGYTYSNLYA